MIWILFLKNLKTLLFKDKKNLSIEEEMEQLKALTQFIRKTKVYKQLDYFLSISEYFLMVGDAKSNLDKIRKSYILKIFSSIVKEDFRKIEYHPQSLMKLLKKYRKRFEKEKKHLDSKNHYFNAKWGYQLKVDPQKYSVLMKTDDLLHLKIKEQNTPMLEQYFFIGAGIQYQDFDEELSNNIIQEYKKLKIHFEWQNPIIQKIEENENLKQKSIKQLYKKNGFYEDEKSKISMHIYLMQSLFIEAVVVFMIHVCEWDKKKSDLRINEIDNQKHFVEELYKDFRFVY